MPDPERMVAAVHAYVAAFEAESVDAVVALYARDATVEDPIGTPIHKGHDAIRTFYARAVTSGAKLKLEGAVRIAGDYAAFPFSASVENGENKRRTEVIDTFRFNDENEIVEMRAFWGPANKHS
jgi:steroid delta-isomerase